MHINVMSKNKEVDFSSEKDIAIKNTAGAFELLYTTPVDIKIIWTHIFLSLDIIQVAKIISSE